MGKPAAQPTTQTQTIAIDVAQPARDEMQLRLDVDSQGEIVAASLTGIGCTEMLSLLKEWRPRLKGPLRSLNAPSGTGHAVMLLREAILRAKGEWDFPYKEEELCHCRAVPTAVVDSAVVGGCHTVEAIRRATSASTSCGTCRPDVEKVIAYRRKG